jgi:hypothetical protein
MRRVLIAGALAVAGVLASASVAAAAPGFIVSFGGNTFGTTTTPTRGVSTTESPDKLVAGDASGIQWSHFGLNIDSTATVNQTVTTTVI